MHNHLLVISRIDASFPQGLVVRDTNILRHVSNIGKVLQIRKNVDLTWTKVTIIPLAIMMKLQERSVFVVSMVWSIISTSPS